MNVARYYKIGSTIWAQSSSTAELVQVRRAGLCCASHGSVGSWEPRLQRPGAAGPCRRALVVCGLPAPACRAWCGDTWPAARPHPVAMLAVEVSWWLGSALPLACLQLLGPSTTKWQGLPALFLPLWSQPQLEGTNCTGGASPACEWPPAACLVLGKHRT